ncbi:MAG: hypothetical protein KF749_01590 [Bacteroidetes bacterium]|nr:hypothetical protein [Bacteroidota bacterium]MCW5896207.1 hypothetical protein [Bacteroidota bacterium]
MKVLNQRPSPAGKADNIVPEMRLRQITTLTVEATATGRPGNKGTKTETVQ